MSFDKKEFAFPDEVEDKKASAAVDEDAVEYEIEADPIEIDVVDDTPKKDRNRKPMKETPEEVTEEELAEYSDKVQHRLKHFSRGYHDERRAKEAALREREEAMKLAQQIVAENRQLRDSVAKHREEEAKQAKLAAEGAMILAKRKVKEAYEAGDADEMVKGQEEMSKAMLRLERAEEFVPNTLQNEGTVVASQPSNVPAPQADPRAAQWQAENKWFGADEEMTSFALGLHQKLLKQGVNPRSEDYYEKINSRMRQVFPENFDEVEEESEPKTEVKPKKANVVAPATRSVAPRKITLTATQVSIAKRLGVPLELYAKKVAEEMRKQNG